jgi:hypothetical protein
VRDLCFGKSGADHLWFGRNHTHQFHNLWGRIIGIWKIALHGERFGIFFYMTDTFLDVFSKKNKRQCTSLVLLAEAKKALTLRNQ